MSVFKEQWFWLIVIFAAIIMIVPFVIIYVVLLLPPIWGPALFTVALVIVWAFVSGYKDYVTARRKEEEEKSHFGSG
jgi:uncharacterized membrane-anchored protein